MTFDVAVEVVPLVDSLTITSTGPYAIGEAIDVTVTFSETVTVDDTGGTPQITLIVGTNSPEATYTSGTASANLVFRYTVLSSDPDGAQVGIEANSLSVNSGTIEDADGNAAFLAHAAVAADPAHVVDTAAPMDEAEERTAELNEQILPRIIPAVLDGSNQLVIDRLRRRDNSAGRGSTAIAGNSVGDSGESSPADLMQQLGQWLYSDASEVALSRQLQQLDEFELRKFIGDLSFDADGERIGMDGTALYGSGSYGQLSGGEDGVDWDGDLIGGYVGIDKWLQEDMLVGVSISYFKGEFDYDDPDSTDDGKYDVNLTSVHPYIGWSVSDDLDVWASIGYGTGEVELVDSAGSRSRDLEYGAVSVGANGRLYASDELIAGGRSELRLRGEVSVWQLDFDRNGGGFNDLSSQRARLVLEASHSRSTTSGNNLRSGLELGVRHDGGDGQSGQGIELGGSVEWRDAKRGLTLSGSGRVLTLAEYNEWGLSGELRVESKSDGRGLSLSLSPSYGRDGSSIGRLWSDGASAMSNAGQSGSADLRMDGEVGYGVWALGGTVRPYLGASLLDGGGHAQRLGVRFELGRGVRMELEGGRRAGANAEAEHNIQLRWKWSW